MGRGQQPSSNRLPQQLLNPTFQLEIHPWWPTRQHSADQHLIAAAGKTKAVISLFIRSHTQQQHRITGLSPTQTNHLLDVLHQADHAHHRGRMDGLKRAVITAGLVVEGDVAAGDRCVQSTAGLRDPTASHGQLPVPLGCFRRREIEVVGDRQWFCTDATQVAGSFSNGRLSTTLGIQSHPTVGAIHRGSHTPLHRVHGSLALLRTQAHHSGIRGSGGDHRIGKHLLVVLTMHPTLAGDGRIIKQGQQNACRVVQSRELTLLPLPKLLKIRRRLLQQIVLFNGRVIRQSGGRHLSGHLAVMQHAHQGFLQHLTHHSGLQTPASEALHQRFFTAGLHHKQHPLLGLREQKFVGRHALFAGRNPIEVELNPQTTFGRHFRTAAGESGSPHVLSSHHITTGKCLQTGLDQPFFQERIANLNGRAVIQGIGTEFSTGETGAAHAIPTGGAAHVNHRIPHPLGAGLDDLFGLHQTQRHGVHQRIPPVGGIESHFTTNGGHTNAIAVMGDAGHNAFDQPNVDGVFKGAETQCIQQRDRASSHGEDVPQDAADAGGGTLEGLHSRGVVVAFNLESQAMAFPQVDHTGIFTRTHQNSGTFRWKPPQQRPGVAIAAVFGPHHPEHPQLGTVGLPSKPPTDLLPIRRFQTFLFQSRIDVVGRGGHAGLTSSCSQCCRRRDQTQGSSSR